MKNKVKAVWKLITHKGFVVITYDPVNVTIQFNANKEELESAKQVIDKALNDIENDKLRQSAGS